MSLAHIFGLPWAVVQTVAPNVVGKDFYWGAGATVFNATVWGLAGWALVVMGSGGARRYGR